MFAKLAFLAMAYLLGSVPVGLILTTLYRDVDIREQGSGNIGATNVLRTSGRGLGAVTLSLDVLKGLLPVLIAAQLYEGWFMPGVVGLLTVVGHCWSIYLEFKGGKGVATATGVMLGLAPLATLAAAAVWAAVFFGAGRRVSLASLAALVVLPLALILLGPERWLALGLGLGLLIVGRHKTNIQRLMSGSEAHF